MIQADSIRDLGSGPLPLLKVPAGMPVPIQILIVDGHNRYAVSVYQTNNGGLFNPDHVLQFKPDAGWEDRGDYWTTPNSTSNREWTFSLTPSETT